MAEGYFAAITSQLGISIWFLVLLILWSAVWKLIALWKSARNNSLVWFIVLAVLNTAGILPILYIFVFSKMGKEKKRTVKKKPKRKKK